MLLFYERQSLFHSARVAPGGFFGSGGGEKGYMQMENVPECISHLTSFWIMYNKLRKLKTA